MPSEFDDFALDVASLNERAELVAEMANQVADQLEKKWSTIDRALRLEMIAFGIQQLEILQREAGSIARRLEILADAGEAPPGHIRGVAATARSHAAIARSVVVLLQKLHAQGDT